MKSARQILLERFDYSSTQIPLPREQAQVVTAWGKLNVPVDALAPDSWETEPHVTALYGLEENTVSEEMRKIIEGSAPIVIRLDKATVFHQPDQDVVVVRVNSPGLRLLYWQLASKLKHHSQWSSYQPHTTVAYCVKDRVDSLEGAQVFAPDTPSVFTADFIDFCPAVGDRVRLQFKGKIIKESEEPFESLGFPTDCSQLARYRIARRAKRLLGS